MSAADNIKVNRNIKANYNLTRKTKTTTKESQHEISMCWFLSIVQLTHYQRREEEEIANKFN